MRRRLAATGVVLLVLGLGIWAIRRFWLLPTYDKDAFYLLGHWFDALWEVQVPLFVVGALLVAVAGIIRSKTRSSGTK